MRTVILNELGIQHLNQELMRKHIGYAKGKTDIQKIRLIKAYNAQVETNWDIVDGANGVYCKLYPWCSVSGDVELIEFDADMFIICEI
jgi:hypothetical protein